tara:strand:+ start:330 stop:605 length:276 start_codon:yes stop_codon:yes gene_type:complete
MNRSEIQKIIDEDINPSLEMHDGYVEIKNFDENSRNLEIIMGGGCKGCASSKITMINGITMFLKEEFPDIGDIIDVTDHSAGENPYFKSEE